MKYLLKTNNASQLIGIVLKCLNAKEPKDPKGNKIETWSVKKNDKGEYLLVHMPDQWIDKGCLSLTPNKNNNEVEITFYYWSSFPQKEKSAMDEPFMLGRFIELMLVHFTSLFAEISIK